MLYQDVKRFNPLKVPGVLNRPSESLILPSYPSWLNEIFLLTHFRRENKVEMLVSLILNPTDRRIGVVREDEGVIEDWSFSRNQCIEINKSNSVSE